MRTFFLAPFVLLGATLSVAVAQYPLTQNNPQPPRLPPPLYIRVSGPQGMHVTFFRAGRPNRLEAPFTVALRPGYSYRVAVDGLDRFPNQTFYPTLEVRGSLALVEKFKVSDFPAGIAFTDIDFARAQAGAVVKKVILLEKTEYALAQATNPDRPIEMTVAPNRDPLIEARDHGLPLLVLHMGHRELTKEDLADEGIPGTFLLPDEKVLPLPRVMPPMPSSCYPVYDPLAGPAPPWPYYSLPNGSGDGARVAVDRDGQLRGLGPADTVAEYEDSRGNKRIAVSNRVCLLVPRFLVAKGEMTLGSQVALFGSGSTRGAVGQQIYDASQPPQVQHQNMHLEATRERMKASGADNLFGTIVTGNVAGLDIKANLAATSNLNGTRQTAAAEEAADRPLKIDKWPDKCGGVVGDLITFYVKYRNHGGQPISNIAVTDHLITRYEYVPGSARADREASFTTQPNDSGSATLRWEFPGALMPGETGIVSFQVRIR